MTFWMWTILIGIILSGWIINVLDMRQETKLSFSAKEMPNLKPIVIETKGKGFWVLLGSGLGQLEGGN